MEVASTTPSVPVTGAMVLAFAAVHIFVNRLKVLDVSPRSRWLSFSGGIAVSYVFLHVLPDLGAHQQDFARAMEVSALAAESAIYSVALAGLAAFYGLERAVKMSRSESRKEGEGDKAHDDVLFLHLITYGTFNVLVGYLLLHREETGAGALLLFFVALSLHFLTADYGMRQDHKAAYDRIARWVIAACVVAGWLLGVALELSDVTVGMLFAFLAGAIILNVLKEELPEERKSYFLPFLGGILVYAALVMAERHFV